MKSKPKKKKKKHPKVKAKLHPRNLHRGRYDLELLVESCPELEPFVILNDYGDASVDFFNPASVKMLNKALLQHYYGIVFWEIPPDYLCPPIPGRADYIHHIADLLLEENGGKIPEDKEVKVLDIGVGANCVYPIIGVHEYGWTFVGSEIDEVAIASANEIIAKNPHLTEKVEIRLQKNPKLFFQEIIKRGEQFDLVICNPPFHTSKSAAQSEARRKVKNLKGEEVENPVLNFGGQSNELWCMGGEEKFVGDMVEQSVHVAKSVVWFSALISKQLHLNSIYSALKKAKATEVRTIRMGQGNKVSRIVAWTFRPKKK